MTFAGYLHEKADFRRCLSGNCFDLNVARKLRELAEDLEKKSVELDTAATLAKRAPHLNPAGDAVAAQPIENPGGADGQMDRD
jgi:hypothetical protein